MDKGRSKSSLEIAKPHSQRAFPQQKPAFSPENKQVNPQRKDLEIKASDLKQPLPEVAFTTPQTPLKKQSPKHEPHQQKTRQDEAKSAQTPKINLFSGKVKHQNQFQPEEVNFLEFFAEKNKYSKLSKINNSFMQVIESGKMSISPQKQSICYKKGKSLTEPNIDQKIVKEQEKMKIISMKKQSILQELNRLYNQEREVRNNKKALALAVKANHSSTKLSRISRIVESPIKGLTTLENQENSPEPETILNKNSSIRRLNRNSGDRILEPSPDTERKSIAKILKEGAQKQLYFTQKQKELLEKAEKQKEKAVQEEKLKIQQGRQRRRSKIMQRLQKSKSQRESTNRSNREPNNLKSEPAEGLTQNQFFTQIQVSPQKKDESLPKSLPKKYIYKQFEKYSAEKKIERQKYEEQILQKRREKTKVDFEEIRVHLQKYKQIKMQKIQLEREKIQSMRNQQKERLKQIRQKYGFLTKIKQNMLEEQKKSIELMENQIDTKANYRKKMREYFISVKDKTQPQQIKRQVSSRVKTSMSNENEETNQENSLSGSRNLTVFKHSTLENNKSKNKTQFMSRKKASSFENSKTDDQMQKTSKYKNYLEDMRKNTNGDESFEMKQKTMMHILKNESSSLEDIQKAFGIFKDLNKSFWQGNPQNVKKMIKRQGHLLQSGINQEQQG